MVPSIPRDTKQQRVALFVTRAGTFLLMRLTWARVRLCEQSCGESLKA
ncbi:hypothetical protein LINPERHAP1_LOCUS19836 [Linum perenne]